MGVFALLVAYVVGGLTFLPGLCYLYFIYLPSRRLASEPPVAPEARSRVPLRDTSPTKLLLLLSLIRAGELEELRSLGLEAYKEGWILVTTEYLESADDLHPAPPIQDLDTKLAYLTLYKLAQHHVNDDGSTIPHPVPPPRNVNAASASASAATVDPQDRKHRYYAVLKHGNLFLYKDERCADVKHVIVLSNHFVRLWPPQMMELALFTKYSAIAVIPLEFMPMMEQLLAPPPPKGAAFFIYCDYNIDKEDWWFALIRATRLIKKLALTGSSFDPMVHAKTLHFDTKHMIDLISTLYSSEGQLQTKWLNALLGRLFLGLQRTHTIHNWLYAKLLRKLTKIKKPGFMDEFKITHIYPGDSAPYFTYPQLKEINPDGTVILLTYLTYTGKLLVEVATKMSIAVAGLRLNKRDMDVTLKITLNKFAGPMLIKIKPPPSERVWYTYETEPQMELKIEPVVLSRQLLYNFVTNLIQKKFEEAIRDLLVLPHWDDITFYDTQDEVYRGGIWDKLVRPETGEEAEAEVKPERPPLTRLRNLLVSLATQLTKESKESTDQEAMDEVADDLPDRAPLTKRIQKAALSTFSKAQVKAQAMKQRLRSSKSFTLDGLLTVNNDSDVASVADSIATAPAVPLAKPQPTSLTSLSTGALKKIGKWYFKDDKPPSPVVEQLYTPPQMISNRRGRKTSNVSMAPEVFDRPPIIDPDLTKKPSYDFGNVGGGFGGSGGDTSSIHSNDESSFLEDPPLALMPSAPQFDDAIDYEGLDDDDDHNDPPMLTTRELSVKLRRKPPPVGDEDLSMVS